MSTWDQNLLPAFLPSATRRYGKRHLPLRRVFVGPLCLARIGAQFLCWIPNCLLLWHRLGAVERQSNSLPSSSLSLAPTDNHWDVAPNSQCCTFRATQAPSHRCLSHLASAFSAKKQHVSVGPTSGSACESTIRRDESCHVGKESRPDVGAYNDKTPSPPSSLTRNHYFVRNQIQREETNAMYRKQTNIEYPKMTTPNLQIRLSSS